MPRQTRLRKIVSPPNFEGFKPYGTKTDVTNEVELLFEEYETIKLADYDLMYHKQASELMGISRATFSRIYESARRKIAKALVETREIKSVYGNSWNSKDWFICNRCKAKFTMICNHLECPLCNTQKIEPINNKQ